MANITYEVWNGYQWKEVSESQYLSFINNGNTGRGLIGGVETGRNYDAFTLQTNNANAPRYIALANIRTDGMPAAVLKMWEQIEIWYGDPQRRETGSELLYRLMQDFKIEFRPTNEA